MPFPAKTANVSGLLALIEGSYGVFGTPSAATDGILLALSDRYPGLVKKSWLYDGALGPAPGNTGMLPRNIKEGPAFEAEFPVRMKGYGAAYSAANKPNIHTLLLISGLDGAFSGGVGSEKWTYTITSDSSVASSASIHYYHNGQVYPGTGALASMSYDARGGGPPLFKFATKMIQNSDVIDASLPSITYPNLTVFEPNAFGGVFTLGSFLTANVRAVTFTSGRGLETVRPNLNGASRHLGWVSTGWDSRMTITIERTAFVGSPFHTSAGINYYKLAEAATQVVGLVQFGTVQYNRMKHNFPTMQMDEPTEGNDGGVATVDLSWVFNSSTPGSTYDWTNIVFD